MSLDPGPGNVLAGAVDDDRFWALIDEAVRASESAAERFAARADALEDGLSRCTAEEVIGFAERFEACQARAYRWDLWAAAHILGGGCSHDTFIDFRSWLISLGRTRFEAALVDAESLATLEFGVGGEDDAFFEEFGVIAEQVYEDLTGDDLPELAAMQLQPAAPSGEPWRTEEEIAARLPKLWATYGRAT